MTEVLSVPRPATYYGGGSVSPTAVYPLPEPPSKDDSADVYSVEALRRVSLFGEGSKAKLILPKTADAGSPRWSGGAEERHFTNWIAEYSFTPPDDSSDLEQIDKTRKESLSEALQTAVPNVLDNSKRPYNILTVQTSLIVLSQKTEHSSGTFLDYVRSFEQFVKSQTKEDVPAPLADALRDLHKINDEAEEEGIAPPSEMEEEARAILHPALTPTNLAQAIHARFAPLGGVELDIPPREPMREPPQLD